MAMNKIGDKIKELFGYYKEIEINAGSFDLDNGFIKNGYRHIKKCNCGYSKPKRLKGLIDTSCRNCGGEKKQVRYK